jgi:hypothetical protein
MKKRVTIFLLVMISILGFSQRLKYSELVLTFNGMSDEEIRNELKDYMTADNEQPNLYIRLGLIYEKVYKNTDPLTDFKMAISNAAEASSRFLQATQYVDAKEVNRNNEYYLPLFPNSFDSKGKPGVDFSKVSARIKSGMDSANLFKQKIPPIYYNFTHSVNSYDKAVKNFASICNQYESIEDLYLLFDEPLEAKLTQLKTDYDSSIYYFNQYLTLINDYPIRYHKQTHTIKHIETFRLDGFITRLNFLGEKVEFWDYGTWVDGVRKAVSSHITDLRTKLMETETKLQEAIGKAASRASDFKPYQLKKQLVLDLNNVDKESAVLSLLHYQEYIQNWLHSTKTFTPDTANNDRNAVVYSDFIHQNRHADTLIKEVSSRITDLKVTMHKEFVGKFFGNKSAFEKYVSDESSMISKTYQDFASSLRGTILKQPDSSSWMLRNKENVVRFTGKVIPLKIKPLRMEDLDKGLMITLFNEKNPDGSGYLAGIHKPDKKINNMVVFAARVMPDGRVAWFNSFNPKIDTTSATPDANQIFGPAVITPEGLAFVIRSEHLTTGVRVNTFIYLSDEGKPKVKFTLADNSYPRFLKYHEKLNAFIFVFKGIEAKLNYSQKEDATLLCVNVLKDVMWKKGFQLTGNVMDATMVSDGLLLAGNFMTFNDSKGNEVRTKINALESNPFLLKVGEKGELNPMPISVPFSFYLTKMARVADNSVNLIGVKESFETGATKQLSPNDQVLHIMATKFGQVIYTNY